MLPLKPLSWYLDYHAKRSPTKLCIACEDREYSFYEVNMITSHIAKQLWLKGVKRNSVVGIYAERSELIPLFIISIAKAGATYVPLHEDFPRERLAFIIQDSNIKGILTDGNKKPYAWIGDRALWSLEIDLQSIKSITTEFKNEIKNWDILPTFCSISDRVAVYYTSGSSGKPKGVIHSHKSIMTSNLSECQTLQLTTEDRLLLYTHWTICFSITSLETIIAGGSLFIATNGMCMDLYLLQKYAEEKKISIIHMPTQIGFQYSQLFCKSNIRLLYLGGSPFPTLKNDVSFNIVNVYGSTEGMALSYYQCVSGKNQASLGIPYNHTKWFVVNDQQEPVKKGDVGELLVSSDCIALGYQNLPHLTVDRFFQLNGVQSFATNDLVKENRDGSFTYIGRKDQMIKVRGIRIEPEEIAFNILQNKNISQACVCLKVIKGTEYLCAYFVQNKCALPVTSIELCNNLRTSLPEHMMPNFFIRVDSLPLNNRGKIDFDSLPEPIISDRVSSQLNTSLSDTETTLLKTIQKTIQNKNVDINDNFFSVGGDSLSALIVVSTLRGLGYQLSVNLIKECQSIKEIASRIKPIVMVGNYDNRERAINVNSLTNYVIGNNIRIDLNQFIIEDFIKSDTRININYLYKSIRLLLSYHKILCCKYNYNNKCLHYDESNSDVIIDERTLDDELTDFYDQLEELINSFYCSFDITHSLFKVILVHLNNYDLIIFGCHHMISDAISKRNIVKDFCQIYSNFLLHRSSSFLRNSPLSYMSYQKSIREYYKSDFAKEELLYWDDIRKQLPYPVLKRINYSNKYHQISTTLESELTSEIIILSNRYKKGLLTICSSALFYAIQHIYNVESSAIQVFLHGRNEHLVDKKQTVYNNNPFFIGSSVGCFVINPPIIIETRHGNNTDLLSNIDCILDSMPNGGLGFDATGGYPKNQIPSFGIDMIGINNILMSDDIYAGCFSKYTGLPHGKPISENLDMGCPYLIFVGVSKGKLFFKVRFGLSYISETDANRLLDNIVIEIKKILKN